MYSLISSTAGPRFLSVAVIMNFFSHLKAQSSCSAWWLRLDVGSWHWWLARKRLLVVVSKVLMVDLTSGGASGGLRRRSKCIVFYRLVEAQGLANDTCHQGSMKGKADVLKSFLYLSGT